MSILTTLRRTPRRASIFIFSVGIMVITGTSVISWVGTVNQMQHTAARDRARLHAITAAEAGVEQVIDYFNNPANFTGQIPADAAAALESSPYELVYEVHPQPYMLFEPYVLRYSTNGAGIPVDANGQPVVDAEGNLIEGREPVITNWTFLTDLGSGGELSSRFPTMQVDIEGNENLVFNDENGRELARVTELWIVNPNDLTKIGDPAPLADAQNRPVCKVIATATTPRGVTMRVESVLYENRFALIDAPGAIISRATAAFDGQYNVKWGEVWSRSDALLKNNWQATNHTGLPKASDDSWFAYRTEGSFMHNGLYLNGLSGTSTPFAVNPVDPASPNYLQPLAELSDTLHPMNSYTDRLNMYQNKELEFPNYDYGLVKEFFLSNGLPIYYQSPDGQIVGRERNASSPNFGQWVKKTYDAWFNISVTDPNYWNTEQNLVFIDTIPTNESGQYQIQDGIPVRNNEYRSRPPIDGVNTTTINSAGNAHTRGIMFIYGHIDFGGAGNAGGASTETIVDEFGNRYVTRPDGVPASDDLNTTAIAHNGLQAVWGTVRNTGQRTVYGSIFTGMGFQGSGSRQVLYNWRLRNGDWLNINQSVVRRFNWDVRRDDPSEDLANL